MLFFLSLLILVFFFFFFSSRRRHTRCSRDWSSDVCSSDLGTTPRCSPRDRTPRSIGPVAADSLRLAPRFVWPSRSAPVSFAADPPTKSEIGRASCRERV